MTTICAKCNLVRPADAQVPDWQCPGCGVAYVKAQGGHGGGSAPLDHSVTRVLAGTDAKRGFNWRKWLLVWAVLCGIYAAYQGHVRRTGAGGSGLTSIAVRLGANPTTDQLAALAAGTQPGDVLMYTADWCPNCRAARNWMDQYGFRYETCDVDKGAGCAQQLTALGSDGVPYLIVKGHHMEDGFDSAEFVAALNSK